MIAGLQDYKQASVMFAARDRGALIFEAFANSPPWFMTISGDPRCYIRLYSVQHTVPCNMLQVQAHNWQDFDMHSQAVQLCDLNTLLLYWWLWHVMYINNVARSKLCNVCQGIHSHLCRNSVLS